VREVEEGRYAALLDAVYDAALDPTRWQSFLDLLAETYGGSALLYAVDALSQTTPFNLAAGFDEATLARYAQHYLDRNPYPVAAIASEVDVLKFAHQVVPAEDVARTAFYSDIMKPTGVSLHHLAIKPVHDENRFAILALAPNLKVFERDPDVAFRELDLLRPHITRAIKMNRLVASQSLEAKNWTSILDSFSAAAFLLDAAGRPIHLNATATALMRQDRLLGLDASGRLKALRAQDGARISALLGQNSQSHPHTMRLTSDANGRAFMAWTVPLPGSRSHERQPALRLGEALAVSASILLLVVRTDVRNHIPVELIRQTFQLTAAEAQLATAICAGQTVSDYATQCSLSVKTARNQLTNVFYKTGTSRQPELVALLLQVTGARQLMIK
jgi:DNA-binding CsgD family transcriptional regulator